MEEVEWRVLSLDCNTLVLNRVCYYIVRYSWFYCGHIVIDWLTAWVQRQLPVYAQEILSFTLADWLILFDCCPVFVILLCRLWELLWLYGSGDTWRLHFGWVWSYYSRIPVCELQHNGMFAFGLCTTILLPLDKQTNKQTNKHTDWKWLNIFNLFQSVRSFIRSFACAWHLTRAFDWTTQWRNHKHGHSGSVHVPGSQPSLRHSACLRLGLQGATHTCAEAYCYYLVRGSCSGYWYVSISISLFGYFSSLAFLATESPLSIAK